jgi:hypothetical protein
VFQRCAAPKLGTRVRIGCAALQNAQAHESPRSVEPRIQKWRANPLSYVEALIPFGLLSTRSENSPLQRLEPNFR